MLKFLKNEYKETVRFMQHVPAVLMAIFAVSVVMMNLLANKSIDTGLSWLALDGGILVSWASFMSMDVIIKAYGPKAATRATIVVTAMNVVVAGVFALASAVPGMWGESYCEAQEAVNAALNGTFAGSWYILAGSTIAFLAASVVNSTVNWWVGKVVKAGGFKEYALRSYVSTAVAQFVDNLVFALIVSLNFFGWSLLQCVTCAATGAIVELVMEVVFSPCGYALAKRIGGQK